MTPSEDISTTFDTLACLESFNLRIKKLEQKSSILDKILEGYEKYIFKGVELDKMYLHNFEDLDKRVEKLEANETRG